MCLIDRGSVWPLERVLRAADRWQRVPSELVCGGSARPVEPKRRLPSDGPCMLREFEYASPAPVRNERRSRLLDVGGWKGRIVQRIAVVVLDVRVTRVGATKEGPP